MASIGMLYSYLPNARCLKIFAAAKINGVNIETAADYQHMATNKTPEFLSKFPIGKVPAFEASDGTTIAESDAIAQYVAESGLSQRSCLEPMLVREPESVNGSASPITRFMETLMTVALCRARFKPHVPEKEVASAKGLAFGLGVVKKHLAGREWLATDKPSLADITLAAALYWAFMHYLDEGRRREYPVTTAWYLRVIGAEGIKEVFGPPNLVTAAKEF
ncbi:eEF-1B gamma subunit-like protein [Trichoderma pleuroticola]